MQKYVGLEEEESNIECCQSGSGLRNHNHHPVLGLLEKGDVWGMLTLSTGLGWLKAELRTWISLWSSHLFLETSMRTMLVD